jgi:polysaccharide deacetylase 2 family uncharacterized protein YibQ
MGKTLAASLLTLLFFVLVIAAFIALDRPNGRDIPLGPPADISVPLFEKEGPGEIHKIPLYPPFPKGDTAQPAEPGAANPTPSEPTEALVAVIIDDLGNNLEMARLLRDLGRPVTAAVLPYAPQTDETVALLADAGIEMMLHLPLEAIVPKEASRGRISSGMSPEEALARVNACLDRIPGCRGANNHEGSRTTEDAGMMSVILAALKDRGLYFIDSLTVSGSVAYETARRMGVPAAERRVFLDGDPSEGAIRRRIVELFRAARAGGRAVGIGHARRETFQALGKYLSLAADYGVRLVPASAIVE